MSGGFESMGLSPDLQRGVAECGYLLPTEVQDEAIPLILGGGDVMVAAPTGSGKTAAFALPVLELVHEKLRETAREAAAPPAAAAAPAAAADPPALSREDRDAGLAVDAAGVRCQARGERWCGARATRGVAAATGKYQFEVAVEDEGLARVGWSTAAAALDLGTDPKGAGYGGTAKKSHARRFEDYGRPYGKGDVVTCWLDLDAPGGGACGFAVNGEDQGAAFAPLPAALAPGTPLFPAVAMRNAQLSVAFAGLKFPKPGFVDVAACAALAGGPAAPAAAFERSTKRPRGHRGVSAIVLEPARDLAEQTHDCFEAYARYVADPPVKCALLIGGVDTRDAERALKAGDVDVVTGTPLKVWDLVRRGTLDCEASCRFFVLDEADRFIETDDVKTCLQIFDKLPRGAAAAARDRRLQVAFFSATLHSDEIRDLARRVCDDPTWVDLKGASHLPESVKHLVVPVDPTDATVVELARQSADAATRVTTDAVHRGGDLDAWAGCPAHVRGDAAAVLAAPGREASSETVKLAKPALFVKLFDALKMEQCIVFCRTNLDCDLFERYLVARGGGGAFRGRKESGKEGAYACCVLAGMRSMEERRRNLEAFKAGDVKILIATDVAARGIDVRGLPFVVNATLPDTAENYVHRVGRVGRADKVGLAVSLVATVPEQVWFCQKGKKPPQRDTRPYAEGGNTVWYDEPALLAAVEAKLGAPVPRMAAADCALPDDLRDMTFGDEAGGGGAADEAQAARLGEIAGDVEALRDLEVRSQRGYFALRALSAAAAPG